MLHIHFGTGRLGLGLVAPFFQRPGSELYLLNRSVSAAKPTGGTALDPGRRNELLRDNPDKYYIIQEPGAHEPGFEVIQYDAFLEYTNGNIRDVTESIIEQSAQKADGVIVTASVLSLENYGAVMQALRLLAEMREQGSVGPVFLVACENTVSAHDVFREPALCQIIPEEIRGHVTCVHALVDRVCVGLEEDRSGPHPTVLVLAEEYGSLKLELNAATEPLLDKLAGSRIEFSRYVDIEKQIKGWLLNGSHWLIALAAFQQSDGDKNLKLNEFLSADPERKRFAANVMKEMRDGVAAILRSDPHYSGFVKDVDPDRYLEGASQSILKRFLTNEDPITRILARFQEPSPDSPSSMQAFSKRLFDRVDEPISAYVAEKGVAPPAATQSVQSLVRLMATGTFVSEART